MVNNRKQPPNALAALLVRTGQRTLHQIFFISTCYKLNFYHYHHYHFIPINVNTRELIIQPEKQTTVCIILLLMLNYEI